jgi:hypothetical protein
MSSIQIIAKQFALHNRLFNNVLEGIQDTNGNKRVTEEVNHLQWIAGHLANSRYNFAPVIGIKETFPYKELYTDPTLPPPSNRPISEAIKYPSLSETLKYWNSLAPVFVEAVSNLSDAQVSAEFPVGTPIGDKTLLGFFGFLTSHESYHIGQMSLVRKYLGLDAMSYK